MSEKALQNIERLAAALDSIGEFLEKLPRVAEVLGVSYFAGRASKLLGGSFELGAVGGAVADGLAHSNLPHNQIGGIALGAYFAGIGLVNTFVPETTIDDFTAAEAKRASTPTFTTVTEDKTVGECRALGGILGAFTGDFKPAGPLQIPQRLLECTYEKPVTADPPPFSAGMAKKAERFL